MMREPIILTENNIKGYGYLLHESGKEPTFDSEQFKFTGDVYKFTPEGEMSVGILVGKKREMKLECLERHMQTVEILIELENDAVIFLAKPSEQGDEIKDIKAFYLREGQAVVLNKGTWHWVPYPFEKAECKTLVIFKAGTPANDCEIKNIKGDWI